MPRTNRLSACAIASAILPASLALAGGVPIFGDDCLPPTRGAYVAQFHSWGGGAYTLSDPMHFAFTACTPPPTTIGLPELHSFSSTVSGVLGGPGFGGGPIPFVAGGVASQVSVTLLSDMGGVRMFDTEMLQLDLVGGGLMVRESPTIPSQGQTQITDMGGGLYRIDSFFDVFTELSLDGGQTWIPSDGPTRMGLVMIPAPPAAVGSGLALLALAGRRRRGR